MRDKANTIIVSLLDSEDFKNCMRKIKPSLREDLISEVSLILLETEPDKIIYLYTNKRLNYYTVKIILTLAFSKTSPFYKKFRLAHNELKVDVGGIDDGSIIDRKITEERALNEIERLEWYDSEMIKLYLKEGTYRKMYERTRIPVTSCCHTVKSGIKSIQKKILA